MKAPETVVVACTVGAILLIFLFPPFMSIDAHSGGRVHASMGYHPIWDPPSSIFAYRTLYPNVRELPDVDRLTACTPRINRVRLTVNVVAIAFGGILTILMLRGGRRWIRKRKCDHPHELSTSRSRTIC